MDTCASKFSPDRLVAAAVGHERLPRSYFTLPGPLYCNYLWNMEPPAACSGRLSAPLPFQQLFQDSPHEQDVDNEEIMLPTPPRALLQCSDACCSYSGNMKLSTERSLPSQQQLSQDSPQEQDAEDEEIVSQFCLRAPVRCSDDFSDDFIAPSIEEVDFDSSKSELVCSNG